MIIHTTLRVLKKHINRAIKNGKNLSFEICQNCIMAETVMDMFPGTVVIFGYSKAKIYPSATFDKDYNSPVCAVLKVKDRKRVEKITNLHSADFIKVKPTSFDCIVETFDNPISYDEANKHITQL